MAPNYAQTLRVIGQALEERRFKDFDIKSEGKHYLIRDLTETEPSSQPVEFRYTREDIERLEQEAQARRRDPSRTPDFTSLSQLLRTVGDYLDARDGRLLGISRRSPLLTIEYETGQRRRREEEHLASSFYDLSVRMYKQRKRRRA
ncbi:MAG: hypothetical protein E6J89_12520 [Deltaproteobacteria bacterium]|nr:MAG: hypothetical protein E6J89_12520 [Deltaproteobacteria bacterium]